MRRLFSLFPLLFCLFFHEGFAQADSASCVLSGSVVARDSLQAIPYATIELLKQGAADGYGAISEEDGIFRIPISERGTYLMKIRCVGYITHTQTLELKGAILQLGQITLERDVAQLSAVTVTARKKLIKLIPSGLTYDIKNDALAQTDNLLFALRSVPMVDVDGSGNIRVKGSSDFSIYLNGRPYRIATANPKEVLRSIPANTIQKVEVITQLDARYDSSAGGAIINIITDKKGVDGYQGTVTLGAETASRLKGGATLTLTRGKLSLSGGYDYNLDVQKNQPFGSYTRTYQGDELVSERNYNAKNTGVGRFEWHTARAMAEYGIDSLNLLYADGHVMFFRTHSTVDAHQTFWKKGVPTQYAAFATQSDRTEGASECNLIYRRLAPVDKSERFSIGYRFSYNPDRRYSDITEKRYLDGFSDWESSPYEESRIKQLSNGGLSEHTLQADYTLPVSKEHLFRVGVKNVLRLGESRPEYHRWDKVLDDWAVDERASVGYGNMHQLQDIVGVYANYSFHRDAFGFNAGTRGEYAFNLAKFSKAPASNFSSHLFDFIPNISASYNVSSQSQLSLSYSSRTRRPSIWSLNPFRSQADAYSVSYGNPHLRSERLHDARLSYSLFSNRYYISLGVDYNYTQNSILSYSFLDKQNPSLMHRTYGNIGAYQRIKGSLYANYRPIAGLSLTAYGDVAHHRIESSLLHLQQKSVTFNVSLSCDVLLPKGWLLGGSWSMFTNPPSAGEEFTPFQMYSFYLKKRLFDNRLDISLTADRPFNKHTHSTVKQWGPGFQAGQFNDIIARSFGITLSYNFASGKSRKVERNQSIRNDDIDKVTGVQ